MAAPALEDSTLAQVRPGVWATRLAVLAVGSGLFMQFIDQTALSTALPTLAAAFHTDPVHLKLTFTSYMIVQALVVPCSGWLADRLGARRLFVLGTAIFVLASLACGFCRSMETFVLCRIIQGMGAATVVPVGRMIVVGASSRADLVKSMALMSTPAMVGPLIGPPLTGLILKVASWPWIFFLNVPIGLLGIAAIMAFVKPVKQPHPGPFDTAGFLLAALTMGGIMIVAESLGFGMIGWQVQVALLAISLACAWAFVLQWRRTEKPILDLAYLGVPSFRASITGGAFLRIAVGATPFLLPLLFQIGLHWSAFRTGMVMIAAAAGSLLARPVAAPLLRRMGFRTGLTVMTLFIAPLTAAPGLFRADTSLVLILAILAAGAFARSLQFTWINTVTYADVESDRVSAATSVYAVGQQLTLSLGVTVGSLVLQLTRINAGPVITPQQFVIPFAVVGAVCLLSLPIFWRLHPDTGADLRGRRSDLEIATGE